MLRRASTLLAAASLLAAGAGLFTVTGASAVPAAPGSHPAQSFTSIFADAASSFTGVGWAACEAPITWSVDVSELGTKAGQAQIANLEWALDTWADASGLTFSFAGQESLELDETTVTLRSATTPDSARHITFAFVTTKGSRVLTDQVVGMGTPSAVLRSADSRAAITRGSAIFSADYVTDSSRKNARALLLHEIGHVLGLGHTDDPSQVMHGMLDGDTTLGAGDIAGVRSMSQRCTS